MRYELWHIETANLIDDFEDQGAALDVTRAYLVPDEDGVTVDVALVVYDDAGQEVQSLQGSDLVALAFGPPPSGMRQSA